MSSAWNGILHRMNWPRLVSISVLAPAMAVLLIAIVAAQGDPGLPPHIPATPVERLCSALAAVIVWPAVAAGRLWRDGNHVLVMWALFLFAGLFWAVLVELLFIARNAWKA